MFNCCIILLSETCSDAAETRRTPQEPRTPCGLRTSQTISLKLLTVIYCRIHIPKILKETPAKPVMKSRRCQTLWLRLPSPDHNELYSTPASLPRKTNSCNNERLSGPFSTPIWILFVAAIKDTAHQSILKTLLLSPEPTGTRLLEPRHSYWLVRRLGGLTATSEDQWQTL